MQYLICRKTKQVVSERQCARSMEQCGANRLPGAGCEAAAEKRYSVDDIFTEAFYRDYKAVYLGR